MKGHNEQQFDREKIYLWRIELLRPMDKCVHWIHSSFILYSHQPFNPHVKVIFFIAFTYSLSINYTTQLILTPLKMVPHTIQLVKVEGQIIQQDPGSNNCIYKSQIKSNGQLNQQQLKWNLIPWATELNSEKWINPITLLTEYFLKNNKINSN